MTKAPAAPPPEQELMQMATGKWVSKALAVVADLAIPDLLREGARPVAELARAAGAAPDPLYRLLRAAAAFGVLNELPDRRFENNGLSNLTDLEMLVMTPGGRERTDAECSQLLQSAGLTMTRIVPTESMVAIVEAVSR